MLCIYKYNQNLKTQLSDAIFINNRSNDYLPIFGCMRLFRCHGVAEKKKTKSPQTCSQEWRYLRARQKTRDKNGRQMSINSRRLIMT